MESLASESSAGSYNEKLKAIYDDHTSGTSWINQFIATPPWTSHLTTNNTNAIDDLEKSSFPAGSTVDMSSPPSPVDLCDFPYLNLDSPTYATTEIEPPYVDDDFPRVIRLFI